MGAITQGAWIKLRSRITCPDCWASFAPEEVLWIATDLRMRGDTQLGSRGQRRFLPQRFDAAGCAVDAAGQPCQEIACPSCHGALPRALLEAVPLHVAFVGNRQARRVLRAAMPARLRRRLRSHFAVDWQDLGEEEVAASAAATCPPHMATLLPAAWHPHFARRQALTRVLCLHDCDVTSEDEASGVTARSAAESLAHSAVICCCLNPTRSEALGGSEEPAATKAVDGCDLARLAVRLRAAQRLGPGQKSPSSLILVVTQLQRERAVLKNKLHGQRRSSLMPLIGPRMCVADESQRLRGLLIEHFPAVVREAESLAEEVIYLPAEALGETGEYGALASRLEMPLLSALAQWSGGLIPWTPASPAPPASEPLATYRRAEVELGTTRAARRGAGVF